MTPAPSPPTNPAPIEGRGRPIEPAAKMEARRMRPSSVVSRILRAGRAGGVIESASDGGRIILNIRISVIRQAFCDDALRGDA
jgi:hypothetical protein